MHHFKPFQAVKKSTSKIGVLAALILSANAGSVSADFIEDSHLDVKLRNAYFDFKNTNSKSNWSQWAQGAYSGQLEH